MLPYEVFREIELFVLTEARLLDERIEEFCGTSAAKGIPPGDSAS